LGVRSWYVFFVLLEEGTILRSFFIYVEILIQNVGVRSSLIWWRICRVMGLWVWKLYLCGKYIVIQRTVLDILTILFYGWFLYLCDMCYVLCYNTLMYCMLCLHRRSSYWNFCIFKKVIVHHQEKFCASSLQYFTMHLKRSLVADRIIRNVSATRNKWLINVRIFLIFLTYVYHDARFREKVMCKILIMQFA